MEGFKPSPTSGSPPPPRPTPIPPPPPAFDLSKIDSLTPPTFGPPRPVPNMSSTENSMFVPRRRPDQITPTRPPKKRSPLVKDTTPTLREPSNLIDLSSPSRLPQPTRKAPAPPRTALPEPKEERQEIAIEPAVHIKASTRKTPLPSVKPQSLTKMIPRDTGEDIVDETQMSILEALTLQGSVFTRRKNKARKGLDLPRAPAPAVEKLDPKTLRGLALGIPIHDAADKKIPEIGSNARTSSPPPRLPLLPPWPIPIKTAEALKNAKDPRGFAYEGIQDANPPAIVTNQLPDIKKAAQEKAMQQMQAAAEKRKKNIEQLAKKAIRFDDKLLARNVSSQDLPRILRKKPSLLDAFKREDTKKRPMAWPTSLSSMSEEDKDDKQEVEQDNCTASNTSGAYPGKKGGSLLTRLFTSSTPDLALKAPLGRLSKSTSTSHFLQSRTFVSFIHKRDSTANIMEEPDTPGGRHSGRRNASEVPVTEKPLPILPTNTSYHRMCSDINRTLMHSGSHQSFNKAARVLGEHGSPGGTPKSDGSPSLRRVQAFSSDLLPMKEENPDLKYKDADEEMTSEKRYAMPELFDYRGYRRSQLHLQAPSSSSKSLVYSKVMDIEPFPEMDPLVDAMVAEDMQREQTATALLLPRRQQAKMIGITPLHQPRHKITNPGLTASNSSSSGSIYSQNDGNLSAAIDNDHLNLTDEVAGVMMHRPRPVRLSEIVAYNKNEVVRQKALNEAVPCDAMPDYGDSNPKTQQYQQCLPRFIEQRSVLDDQQTPDSVNHPHHYEATMFDSKPAHLTRRRSNAYEQEIAESRAAEIKLASAKALAGSPVQPKHKKAGLAKNDGHDIPMLCESRFPTSLSPSRVMGSRYAGGKLTYGLENDELLGVGESMDSAHKYPLPLREPPPVTKPCSEGVANPNVAQKPDAAKNHARTTSRKETKLKAVVDSTSSIISTATSEPSKSSESPRIKQIKEIHRQKAARLRKEAANIERSLLKDDDDVIRERLAAIQRADAIPGGIGGDFQANFEMDHIGLQQTQSEVCAAMSENAIAMAKKKLEVDAANTKLKINAEVHSSNLNNQWRAEKLNHATIAMELAHVELRNLLRSLGGYEIADRLLLATQDLSMAQQMLTDAQHRDALHNTLIQKHPVDDDDDETSTVKSAGRQASVNTHENEVKQHDRIVTIPSCGDAYVEEALVDAKEANDHEVYVPRLRGGVTALSENDEDFDAEQFYNKEYGLLDDNDGSSENDTDYQESSPSDDEVCGDINLAPAMGPQLVAQAMSILQQIMLTSVEQVEGHTAICGLLEAQADNVTTANKNMSQPVAVNNSQSTALAGQYLKAFGFRRRAATESNTRLLRERQSQMEKWPCFLKFSDLHACGLAVKDGICVPAILDSKTVYAVGKIKYGQPVASEKNAVFKYNAALFFRERSEDQLYNDVVDAFGSATAKLIFYEMLESRAIAIKGSGTDLGEKRYAIVREKLADIVKRRREKDNAVDCAATAYSSVTKPTISTTVCRPSLYWDPYLAQLKQKMGLPPPQKSAKSARKTSIRATSRNEPRSPHQSNSMSGHPVDELYTATDQVKRSRYQAFTSHVPRRFYQALIRYGGEDRANGLFAEMYLASFEMANVTNLECSELGWAAMKSHMDHEVQIAKAGHAQMPANPIGVHAAKKVMHQYAAKLLPQQQSQLRTSDTGLERMHRGIASSEDIDVLPGYCHTTWRELDAEGHLQDHVDFLKGLTLLEDSKKK